MDVYYCLLMLLGHRLTGDPRWHAEFSRFVDRLAGAQFEDGGWTYFAGTNECPVYHGLLVMLLARAVSLCGDARAVAMLRRSVPYYPLVVLPSGLPEYHTDCWWKHAWEPQMALEPDVVAAQTGDGRNRGIGDGLRPATLERLSETFRPGEGDNITGLFLAYAALLWRDVAPEPAPAEGMVLDRNIEGPRGRFRHWSWAATARYGSDTLVGAAAHRPEDGSRVTALMAVTPEIAHRHQTEPEAGMARLALGMTPPDTAGTTALHADHCTFEAEYRMACFRSIWDAEAFPSRWTCRQQWRLDPTALAGHITLTSDADQECPEPRVRILFGRDRELEPAGPNCWRYGPFLLRVESADFTIARIEPAPMPLYHVARDCRQLLLTLPDPPARFRQGQAFRLRVVVAVGSGSRQSAVTSDQ